MARTVLPFVGAAIGFWVGGPTGAQVGFALGGVVGNAVDPVKNIGPKIGETGAQTSAEGAPRAIVYGTAPVTGNVIAAGPLIKTDVEEGGGKGGPVNVTERCFRFYAIRICEGPIAGVLRIWEDDKLVYDVRPGSIMAAESAKWLGANVFYHGTEDQTPDAFITVNVDEDNPAYRGTAYMSFNFRDLTDRRGSIPQYRFEVATASSITHFVAPLQIFDWTDNTDTPEHSVGETTYNVGGGGVYDTTSLSDAISFAQTWYTVGYSPEINTQAPYCNAAIGYITPTNGAINRFPSGSNAFAGDDWYCTINITPGGASDTQYSDAFHGGSDVLQIQALGGTSPSATKYFTYNANFVSNAYSGYIIGAHAVFRIDATVPTSGAFSHHQADMPAAGGGTWPITSNVCLPIRAERLPAPPPGYTKIIGAAKQLCAHEYKDFVLYQNALGPVLLPGDPNYNNTTFWANARTAAVDAGLMHDDVGSPVVVSAYAQGSEIIAGAPVPLADIVSDIHARCDVPASTFDVSELDDMVAGLVLAGDYTGADAINTLRGPYFFDKAEANAKLWYPKRGAAVVDTWTVDDLVDEPDSHMREQALEYPRKFHLFYQHANSGYAVVKATSQRSSPDVRVVGEATAQVPVVLNEDQAAQTSHKMHKVSWAEAEGEVKFSVPWSFISRVPSNPIGLFLRDRVSRLRITDMALADGVIDVTCRHDRQSAYTSNVTGVPIPDPTPPPATIVGATTLVVLDIPSLRDEDDDLNVYYAVTGAQPAWHGAVIQRSADGGATWTSVETITNAQVVGELTATLADASADITDTTNAVHVRLYRESQSLESISDAAFLSEGGAFAIKDVDGDIEILQARDWEQDSAGDWVGTMLHRGRLNTVTNAHASGATFVMLDRVRHSPMPSALIGQAVTYRAVSLGDAPELSLEQTETYTGQSQIEWPPASLMLARDGADIITASWAPRHRFGTDDNPVASVNFQGYRITITDGIAPAVVIEQTANTLTYDASALASPVDVIVQSMNRITGAGDATSGTI